jgi:hypothetical protein
MQENKAITHVTAGIIIGAVLILLSCLTIYLTKGDNSNSALQWLNYIIMIAGLIIFINLYGKSRDYRETFGNLFSYGFKTTAVFTLLLLAFVVLFNIIFPDFKEKGFEMARQKMEEEGKLSDTQIDQGIQMVKKYFWAFAIGGTILANLIVGAIGSLIGAAITKKRPYNPLDQLNS